MSQPVLLKVYSNLYPVTEAFAKKLEEATRGAYCAEEGTQIFFHEGNMARIAFEGLAFPVEEYIACIRKHLTPAMTGKLDVLDIEAWQLTRFSFQGGFIQERKASLNSVMDYSGF